jgi:hypothetical protein
LRREGEVGVGGFGGKEFSR